MTAITENNTQLQHFKDQIYNEGPVTAATRVYSGGLVGAHYVTGHLKPFEPGDRFAGVSDQEANNTDGTVGLDGVNPQLYTDSAEGGRCRLITQGDIICTLSGAAHSDFGKAVYAQDSSLTVALTGNPFAYIGRIMGVATDDDGAYESNKVVVRLDIGNIPTDVDNGSILARFGRQNQPQITGATAGALASGDFLYNSTLGLGWTRQPEGTQVNFDATAEVAQGSVETAAIFNPAKGIIFDALLVVSDIGDDASLDIDWGLGDVLSATTRANMDNAALLNHVRFHMNGASDNILAESDDNTTDVTAVDTTIDNDSTTDVMKRFVIIVRTDGSATLWIDGSQVLSSTTFAVGTTAALAGFVNVEKTSNDTVAEVQIGDFLVAGVSDA